MAESVKRESSSKRRGTEQARTRLARRAVVDAARALFLERGYAPTTIDAISARADVPAPTVYRLFSSKLGILKTLLDTSIAGDEQPLAVSERPDVASLFAEPDPRKLLIGFAGVTAAINRRTSDIYRVLAGAATSDPGAAELLGKIREQRAQGQGRIARALARAHALKAGVRQRDAADLIHALMSPEIYRLLVGDRGWSADRYEAWLGNTLIQQLM
jgi:TetR/AcrR family transcriptional regulator, regulator of autoinduction and epiphytic fitness